MIDIDATLTLDGRRLAVVKCMSFSLFSQCVTTEYSLQ